MKSTIVYGKVYQKFTEYDENGVIVKEDFFRIPEWKQEIMTNGPATIVWLEDGSKGVAVCNDCDNFKVSTGRKLAYLRAKIESLNKEIEETIAQTYTDNDQ